jgi:hypothetical protein
VDKRLFSVNFRGVFSHKQDFIRHGNETRQKRAEIIAGNVWLSITKSVFDSAALFQGKLIKK